MRKVYFLQKSQLNKRTDRFEYFTFQIFASKKAMLHYVQNSIDVNKGFDIVKEVNEYLSSDVLESSIVEYKCLSTDGIQMKLRYILETRNLIS